MPQTTESLDCQTATEPSHHLGAGGTSRRVRIEREQAPIGERQDGATPADDQLPQ